MDKIVYQFILDYFREHLYCPTQREIQEATGAASETVSRIIHQLLKEGKLETDHNGSPRALRISAVKLKEKNDVN